MDHDIIFLEFSMSKKTGSNFQAPSLEALPAEDAPFREIGRFATAFDPTLYFNNKWGKKYAENARSLWDRAVQKFLKAEEPEGAIEELLMVMAYEWTLGPYLGLPEDRKEKFLRHLLAAIRRKLGEKSP
jgi:hypothetical protein